MKNALIGRQLKISLMDKLVKNKFFTISEQQMKQFIYETIPNEQITTLSKPNQ